MTAPVADRPVTEVAGGAAPDGGQGSPGSPLRAWWAGLPRTRRALVVVIGFVVGLNVALVGLRSAVGGSPGGPVSSSFSTGGGGLEALADLARASGHEVTRLKQTPDVGDLPPEATVVLADPRRMSNDDVMALARFLSDGGRLVLAGEASAPLVDAATATGAAWHRVEPVDLLLVTGASAGSAATVERPLGSVRRVAGDAGGRWVNTTAMDVLLSDPEGLPVIVSHPVGPGTVVALADADPLHNRNLADEDNAALGLELIGGTGRPLVFFESVHGYGATGIDALPSSWRWTAAGLVLALAAGLWWAGSRLGPPEPSERDLRPARLDHVRAVAASLDRVSRHPADLVGPLTDANRLELGDRLGLPVDSSPSVWQRAAEAGGLDPDVVVAGTSAPRDLEAALYVGALAAHHARLGTEPSEPAPGPSPVHSTAAADDTSTIGEAADVDPRGPLSTPTGTGTVAGSEPPEELQ